MVSLSGVSCSGKSSVLKEMIKLGYEPIISYTTRPIRKGEIDGVDYNFCDNKLFNELKAENFFAETTSYQIDANNIWHYGTAKKDLASNKIAILNPEGLKNLKQNKQLNIVSFLLLTNDVNVWNRLRMRGDDSIEANRRIEADKKDFTNINSYIDFSIRTDNLSSDKIASLIDYIYRKVGDYN